METPTSMRASVEAGLPKKTRVSQECPWVSREWPWISWWSRANVEASLRVSQGGEANDRASPCESRGQ